MLETDEYKTPTALGKAAKVGRKTVERMMSGSNAVTIDSLEAVALVLNVRPWQMLVDGMSAKDLPQLRRPEGEEADLYARLDALGKAIHRLEQTAPDYPRRPKKSA